MSDKLVIALRLPDKKPKELKFNEIAEIFKQFSTLLKGVNDNFGYIEEGSIYVGSPPLDSDEYKIVIDQVLQSDGGDFDQYLSKHKDWGHAQIGVHREGESPKQMKVLRTIGEITKPKKFKQHDTLRGKVNRINTGSENHYVGIAFVNGFKISAKIALEDVNVLKSYLGTDTLLDFSGIAVYSYSENYELYLEEFKLSSYEPLEEDSVEKWISDFVGFGRSGWQDLDDPYKTLEDERLP
ncbi:hypothetical protein [Acinetobacter bereziniae]|uniref:hypothetical protein n=1 Tax=Acinetobacter bereziniae TaxID=106648 RepID=UPI001250C7FA|nr:hypothetical protein [Acinetobacter bereziniae]